ncbi:perforin-1-like [Sphaerodactylus townsendi]|uniref:Uncharacterized protein n=1 Tax=Sphaerodactylus townsendi TaxID=933632 RepID=A0ACB8EWB3_9SAUR|nr:perforin-1-like [Sphaerodactylus townsendi]
MPRWPLFIVACLPVMLLLPPRGSTHCQRFPKSTCEQHTAFVPGYNLLGEGIDITTLQRKGAYLVDTSQWLGPNDTCILCRNHLMKGQLQRLPLATMDWRVRPSCDRQVSSFVAHSDVHVAKVLAEEVKNSWNVMLNLPKEMESKGQVVLAGSQSRMAIYAREKSQQDRYTFVRHEVSCEYYWLRLLPRPSLLSPHFSRDVQNLSSKYDPDEYQHFIDIYGTHYISQAQLGARVRNLLPVRTCAATLAGITASDIKNCLTLEASQGWISHSLSDKCPELQGNQAKRVFREAYGQRRTEIVGGSSQPELLFAEVQLFLDWMNNVTMYPGVVSYSLQPIHTLVDRGNPRRAILKRAVRKYIDQRALSRNCVNRCPDGRYPSSEDSCRCLCRPDSFTDTTCCAREWGVAHLQVHIVKGYSLWGDPFTAADAYVKVFFQGWVMRTSPIQDNNNPYWSKTLDFEMVKLTQGGNILKLEIWDQDIHYDDLLKTCYEYLVAGGKKWKTCHLSQGRIEYYYVLECGPALGGPSCHDYVPQKV